MYKKKIYEKDVYDGVHILLLSDTVMLIEMPEKSLYSDC